MENQPPSIIERSRPPEAEAGRDAGIQAVVVPFSWRWLSQAAFGLFLFLTLATPAWRAGPFTWWPLWQTPMLAGRGAAIGLLSLLPLLVLLTWWASRRPRAQLWHWGPKPVTLAWLGLSILVLISLDTALTWRTATQLIGLGLAWFVYLYVLNEQPDLTLLIVLLVLLQSGIAIGQFILQGDLGLTFLGELSLDPAVEGISVLWARDQPWLRGYGLTAHPNMLGGMLAVALLWLLPAWRRARGGTAAALLLTLIIGLGGLSVTFSRAAWLGLALGAAVWLWSNRPRKWLNVKILLILLPGLLFLVIYGDLAASRFLALGTPLEAQSLNQRLQDMSVAVTLWQQNPLRGVGAGNYLPVAASVDPTAVTAHNVTLLVAAELGLLGLFTWLVLAVAGLAASSRLALAAPWVAMLVISLFDNTLWLTTSWRSAILFALLSAGLMMRLARLDQDK